MNAKKNEDEYLNRLAFIGSFINENNSASVFVVGDLNADLTDNSSVVEKIDVSKASDIVNHQKLFSKLRQRA